MAFDFSKLASLFKTNGSSSGETTVVGVDIGSTAIKVVQLRMNKHITTLDTYGELQLGPYEGIGVGRTTHLQSDALSEAFIDILRESSATARSVAMAVSYNASFTTVITLPTLDPDKIAAMISVEARKYVPVSLSDVTLDWFPVPTHNTKIEVAQTGTRLILAAIHNDAIKVHESLTRGASRTVVCTELELFSTIRTSIGKGASDTIAIIDFGGGSSKLYIVHKGMIEKTHSTVMSGSSITLELSKGLGITFEQAEERKRNDGLLAPTPDANVKKIYASVLDRGFKEIHMVMKQYESESGSHIEKVVLSGGGALLRGLSVYVQDILTCPTTIVDPFSNVAYPAFLKDTLTECGPSFTVALGIALRGLRAE